MFATCDDAITRAVASHGVEVGLSCLPLIVMSNLLIMSVGKQILHFIKKIDLQDIGIPNISLSRL